MTVYPPSLDQSHASTEAYIERKLDAVGSGHSLSRIAPDVRCQTVLTSTCHLLHRLLMTSRGITSEILCQTVALMPLTARMSLDKSGHILSKMMLPDVRAMGVRH